VPTTTGNRVTDAADLVLTAAFALPCDGRGLIRDAFVAVRGGRIAAVGSQAAMPSVAAAAGQQLDFGQAVILPGLVNAHTHLEFTHGGPIRPLDSGPNEFTTWIADLVAWSRRTRPSARLASARAGAAMMLQAGITCVGDIVSRGQGLQAMVEVGLHGTAFCEFVGGYPEDPPCDLEPRLTALRQRVESAIDSLGEAMSGGYGTGIRLGVAPHAPYTVSASALLAVSGLARQQGWPVAVHLAESRAELDFLADGNGDIAEFMGTVLGLDGPLRPAALGVGPLGYARAGDLFAETEESDAEQVAPEVLLVHGAQLSPCDVAQLPVSGVALALCPRSNELLSVGAQAPVALLARTGLALGVGTDSLASNTSLDVFGELRALRDNWMDQQPDANADLVAHRLLRMATFEGATALGLADELGSVAAGKRADLAVFELPSAAHKYRTGPETGLARTIVDKLDAGAVIATFTDGQCRYQRDAGERGGMVREP
jgi:cytosine/adenosine deaminase-related metal-dependent hydrolase